jgi:exodeoxyribonuclease VII large subunit
LSVGRQHLAVLQARLQNAMNYQFERRLTRLKHAGRQLNALSPLATLQRGYGILRDENQHLISSCRQARPGQSVTALLADGTLFLTVQKS